MLCNQQSCGCAFFSESLEISQVAGVVTIETNAFGIVTSSTRPASPFIGQHIFETDTQRELTWTGTDWLIVGGAFPAWNLMRDSGDGGLSIPNAGASNTPLTLPTEIEDSDAFHAASSATVVIPVGLGGDYEVSAGVRYAASATAYRMMVLTFTGNTSEAEPLRAGGWTTENTVNNGLSLSKRIRLEAGAQLTLETYQVSGVALNANIAWFTGTMVRHIPTLT